MSEQVIDCFTLAKELGVKPVDVQFYAENAGVHRVRLTARFTAAEADKVRKYARSRTDRVTRRNRYFAQERASRQRAERAGARLVTSSSPERDELGKVALESLLADQMPDVDDVDE